MPDKIVYYCVYDPLPMPHGKLRGANYTSREEAESSLAWWKTKLSGEADPRWEHLELAIVTIERLPQRIAKPTTGDSHGPDEN